ncbi:hypothetical protein FQN49_004854 [Arthroderma sp. PD_2]|nr:hypothetical protein FQN49_004854 [Arthroderma sp. PD_2]
MLPATKCDTHFALPLKRKPASVALPEFYTETPDGPGRLHLQLDTALTSQARSLILPEPKIPTYTSEIPRFNEQKELSECYFICSVFNGSLMWPLMLVKVPRIITRLIDWQSAGVALLYYHAVVPGMFRYYKSFSEGCTLPGLPEYLSTLNEDEASNVFEDELIHKFYEAQTYKRAPRHGAVLQEFTYSLST